MSATLLRSFAGGEISPELYGRVDLTKFQTGLALCKNFIILPHGPAVNRAGTVRVNEAKLSSKKAILLPFIYNTTQAYELEFGDQYLRIHTQGGTVLEAAQNITAVTRANPGVLTYVGADPTNGKWVYVTGVGGMTQLNGRFFRVKNVNAVANTFELADADNNNIDTTNYTAYTAGGTMAPVYEITTPYLEADLFSLHYAQSADVMTITHPSYQQRELRRLAATNWTLTTLSMAPTIGTPGAPTVVATGAGPTTYTYRTTAIGADGIEESAPGATASVTNDLTIAGNYNSITPAAVAGAIRYNIYKQLAGLYGYIGQSSGAGFADVNITPDMSQTPPEVFDPFPSAGNYPAAVGYFKGRRWFAGTTNKPLNVYATRAGTESNMTFSIPQQDDDAINVRLTALQANSIRHFVPLGDMLVLTSGSEWQLTTKNTDAMTQASIDYTPQGYVGASDVTPVVTSRAVLYAQDRGGHIREMQYKWESSGYDTVDVSIMAPHLFKNKTIKQMAFSRAPHNVCWAVRSDGVLLGMTYLPEHEVRAWHQHVTDGLVESICVVPEGSEDVLYMIVQRSLGSRTVRSIERMSTREFDSLASCYFVDCGLTYSGAPATTITGLWHLEGEQVSILADGAVITPQTVVNGSITLAFAASTVHVGLAYDSDLQTLPLVAEMAAMGQGFEKNVDKVHLRIVDSSGVRVGPSFTRLSEYKQRTSEPYGSPPSLVTGMVEQVITPSWNVDAPICVRQSNPLPLTVSGLVPEFTEGG